MRAPATQPLIRPRAPHDSLEEITELLHRAYARLGAMGLNFTAVDQPVSVTAERVSEGLCFVALMSDRLVGTVVVQPTRTNDECEYYTRAGVAIIQQFAVDPAAQGQGVGRALIDACESWARENEYREIALDTAEPATHLIELYTKLGYAPVASVQWPGKVYRTVVLSKSLRAPPILIRPELPADADAISALTAAAFAGRQYSDGTEAQVISGLRAAGALTLSLVAILDDELVGQVSFSPAATKNGIAGWYALGPVSVKPAHQRRGIGGALIRAGIAALKQRNARGCIVLGDVAYYSRFGFTPSPRHAPSNVPAEHFMVQAFHADLPEGAIEFHPAFFEASPR